MGMGADAPFGHGANAAMELMLAMGMELMLELMLAMGMELMLLWSSCWLSISPREI